MMQQQPMMMQQQPMMMQQPMDPMMQQQMGMQPMMADPMGAAAVAMVPAVVLAPQPVGLAVAGADPQWWEQDQPQFQFAAGQDAWRPPAQQLTYHIKGRPAFAYVDMDIPAGQNVVADGGAMLWMESSVQMNTWCYGGCCASYWRQCSGESGCQNKFSGPGKVGFGFDLPGDILPFAVAPGQGWILTSAGFVCGTENVHVTTQWSGCGACLFGGEGPFFTRVSCADGTGVFFAGGYGSIERHEIPAGKQFFVDTSLFFAAHESTAIDVGTPGGCMSFLCSGEGFIMKFNGPCVLYTQSRDPRIFSHRPTNDDRAANNTGAAQDQAGLANQMAMY
jgi:uncharacterized protein (TIGR00266 family)